MQHYWEGYQAYISGNNTGFEKKKDSHKMEYMENILVRRVPMSLCTVKKSL